MGAPTKPPATHGVVSAQPSAAHMAAPSEAGELASAPGGDAPQPSRLARILKRIWWLHSFFALAFGVGVMLFARAGLAHADKVMMALLVSWLLMFVALRFIVGPTNRRSDESVGRKGVRLVTNYIIKQFYQQMFFFLVPLYAASATWAWGAWNGWLAPVLLACAVVSTMDLVFDNYIMERRWLASAMYGLAMFGVLNVLGPLVFGVSHLTGLLVAAGATPTSVALLSFPARQVLSSNGILVTIGATALLLAAVWMGRVLIPPAPLALAHTAIGHGSLGSYECLPGKAFKIRADQLDGLRCGSLLREPGGIKEGVVHVWRHRGVDLARLVPERLACDQDGVTVRSTFPRDRMPVHAVGTWQCFTFTEGGQLVGQASVHVVAPPGQPASAPPNEGTGGGGAGSGSAGSGGAGSGGAGSGGAGSGGAGSGGAGSGGAGQTR